MTPVSLPSVRAHLLGSDECPIEGIGLNALRGLVEHVRQQQVAFLTVERMQQVDGRIETARLAISGETDVEHVESLRRRLGGAFSR